MAVVGIDIGTTSIKCIGIDEQTGLVLQTLQAPNHFGLGTGEQDAEGIYTVCQTLLEEIRTLLPPISAIGLSGQMHGILYVDNRGMAVSPLYTWQYKGDERQIAFMQSQTGYALSQGFGCVTYYQHQIKGRIPDTAVCLCTIADYVGMRLCRRAKPLLHTTQAASLGLYNLHSNGFDQTAFDALHINPAFFPEVSTGRTALGQTGSGAPVYVALGDHQASFLGATGMSGPSIAVNIGTGSQVSVAVPQLLPVLPPLEMRPFLSGHYLLTGAVLSGGQAYAVLERFFQSCASLLGVPAKNLYSLMNEAALNHSDDPAPLSVCTDFLGTRQEPTKKGAITNIGPHNLTAQNLIAAFIQGMATALYSLYAPASTLLTKKPERIIASGNAIRQNPALRKALEKRFGMPLSLPACSEEAAYGAAVFASSTF